YACANTASTFTINFTPGEGATSSSWSLPANTWRINGGQGVIYQYSYNVGAVTSVTISVPAGVPAGTYEIHATGNGPCGSSGHRSIPVVIGRAASVAISGSTNTLANRTYDYRLEGGSNFVWSATEGRIIRGQGTNTIGFTTPSRTATITLSVNFTDVCGSPASATLEVDNTSRPQPCRTPPCPLEPAEKGAPKPVTTTPVVVPGLYPNPASTEVLIATEGHSATATIRDYLGVVRKTVELRENNPHASVDVKDLPEGIYNVRVVGKDQQEVRYKLQIRR
ncbi:MAG TPA: T9SS type A sorting domain-containing protein, partial [Hymenobacter sp.]|nr:T9SS type A sorting domain-containing protein [Hymenobacter sp.]